MLLFLWNIQIIPHRQCFFFLLFFLIVIRYESNENVAITCSTKVCSFGKQVVEKVETEHPRLENGRFVYRIYRSPMCEYMINFIHKLKHLPEKYMMNSVLENFTILQVLITNKIMKPRITRIQKRFYCIVQYIIPHNHFDNFRLWPIGKLKKLFYALPMFSKYPHLTTELNIISIDWWKSKPTTWRPLHKILRFIHHPAKSFRKIKKETVSFLETRNLCFFYYFYFCRFQFYKVSILQVVRSTTKKVYVQCIDK